MRYAATTQAPAGGTIHRLSRRSFVAASALAFVGTRAGWAQTVATNWLTESAALASGSMTARIDPTLGYQPYFHLNLGSTPPEAEHSSWDYVDTAGRFVAAFLALHRLGIAQDTGWTEAGLQQFFLANQRQDGLFYDQAAPFSVEKAEIFAQSRAMLGLVAMYLSSGSSSTESRIESLIRGLSAIAEPARSGVILPGREYLGGWLDRSLTAAGAADRYAKPGYGALVAEPLVAFARATGNRTALGLAERLIQGFIETATVDAGGGFLGHTHSWGILPMANAMVDYALLAQREDLYARAVGIYEFAVAQATPWGWIPDGIGFGPGYIGARSCETCGLADLINLGIKLGRNGHPGAWANVERFSRNQLLQNQFRHVEWVIGPESAELSQTHAADILRGSFEAWARPNSLLGGFEVLESGGLEACCTGSAVLTLANLAEATVEHQGTTVWVNLPITVSSRWAEVRSYSPAEGYLEVVPHDSNLRIRVPDSADLATIQLSVGGTPRDVVLAGDYVALDGVAPGSPVRMQYQLPERTETRRASDLVLSVRWKGNAVTAMSPQGERYPLFVA